MTPEQKRAARASIAAIKAHTRILAFEINAQRPEKEKRERIAARCASLIQEAKSIAIEGGGK